MSSQTSQLSDRELRAQRARHHAERLKAKRATEVKAARERAEKLAERRRLRRLEHEKRNEEGLVEQAEISRLGPAGRRQRLARDRAAMLRQRAERREAAALRLVPAQAPNWALVPTGPGFCSPTTGRCSDARDYKKTRRPCCVAINREVLRFTVDLLDALEIPYWADYGTLLGAVRHGGMIPWDKDNDLGILQRDKDQLLRLEQPLRKLGLGGVFRRHGTIKLCASRSNTTNTDIFAWAQDSRGQMSRRSYAGVDQFKGKAFPAAWIFPLVDVQYDGLTLKAPAAVLMPGKTPAPKVPGFEHGSLFLEHRYGPGWMNPLRANNDGVRR